MQETSSDFVERELLQNIWHELRGSLALVYRFTDRLAEETRNAPPIHARVAELQRALRRVRTGSFIFNFIAAGGLDRVTSSFTSMTLSEVFAIVSESVEDLVTINSGSRRLVACKVDRKSFQKFAYLHFAGDKDLLIRCANNILSNAFQYSYPNTTVFVRVRKAQEGALLEVRNTGIELSRDEITHIGERGWRGREACKFSDGSGLGLWIVSHIAKAHGGYLRAVPTNSRGETCFQLFLPMEERS
jgi:signal transduction histidine kinase